MLRKVLSFIVLAAMIVHCASRLGVISYLYQKRHSIAYSIGAIAEIPIAMCTSDYDFGHVLKIETSSSEPAMPVSILAQEINLFFVSSFEIRLPQQALMVRSFFVFSTDHYQLNSVTRIFHPPLT